MRTTPRWSTASLVTCCNSTRNSLICTVSNALALWRGVPLVEFREQPFARTEISRLRELQLSALSARIQADLTVGRHAELIAELEGLTGQFPLHEGFRAQLMLSLYRSGRQAEALEAYRLSLPDERRVFAGCPWSDAGWCARGPGGPPGPRGPRYAGPS